SRVLGRVHGTPRLPTRRRAALPRLEDPRPGRPPVREAVRARDEFARHDIGLREPVDGVARCAHPAHEAVLCRPAGGGARADLAATARRHGADHLRRSRAQGSAGAREGGTVGSTGARSGRHAGRRGHGGTGGPGAPHVATRPPWARRTRLRPAVRPCVGADGSALPASSWPSGDRAAPDGSGGGRAVGPPRGAVPGSGVHGERGGPPARAGAGLSGNGASGDRRMAHGVPAARPLFPTQAGGGSLHQPTALAVIFDNSASSGLVVDGRPVLERLKAVARGSLVRATSSDRLWLVLADGVARAGTPDALLATLDSAGVSARRMDVTAAVRAATRLVDAAPFPAREVHVVSDLQRT